MKIINEVINDVYVLYKINISLGYILFFFFIDFRCVYLLEKQVLGYSFLLREYLIIGDSKYWQVFIVRMNQKVDKNQGYINEYRFIVIFFGYVYVVIFFECFKYISFFINFFIL